MLTSEDNLNDIRDIGIYWYTTGNVPANAPYPNASVVEVIGSGMDIGQIIQRGYRYGATGYSAFRAVNDVYPDAQQWSYIVTNNSFRFVTGAELSVLKSLEEFMAYVPRNSVLKMLNSNTTERTVLVNLGLLPFANSGFLTITRNSSDYITLEYVSFGNVRQQAVINSGKLSSWI